jgi:hypothetical protein
VYIGDLRLIVLIIIKQRNQAFTHALNHCYPLFQHRSGENALRGECYVRGLMDTRAVKSESDVYLTII